MVLVTMGQADGGASLSLFCNYYEGVSVKRGRLRRYREGPSCARWRALRPDARTRKTFSLLKRRS